MRCARSAGRAGHLNEAANDSLFPGTTEPSPSEEQEVIDRLLAPQIGRAYGLELLLRRQSEAGLFGWLSYTLSRAERKRDGEWVPYERAGTPVPVRLRGFKIRFFLAEN